ncbi:hypothetical protein PIB30_099508, partial [Stylosanthes scabra]|nr:hypothetical protein [Stylosanthes scabra]
PVWCITSIRMQQNMVLPDRVIPYLEAARLYLAWLNNYWFKVDESFVNAFIERSYPDTHAFHMPFGECTMTL